MRDKHGVYGRRQLLSLYSTIPAHSDDVQSRLRSLGLWTVCHLNGKPRLPLLRPPGRSSTSAVANDASSRQRRLRHNREPPDHTCKSTTAAVGDHCTRSRRSSVAAVHCCRPCVSRGCGASVKQSAAESAIKTIGTLLFCRTQARKSTGSNRSRDAVE